MKFPIKFLTKRLFFTSLLLGGSFFFTAANNSLWANQCRLPLEIKRSYNEFVKKVFFHFGDIENAERSLRICRNIERFYEVAGGSQMRSFYERSTSTIYVREFAIESIEHEFLHFYLDEKLLPLPYFLSEILVKNTLLLLNSQTPITQSKVETKELVFFLKHILTHKQIVDEAKISSELALRCTSTILKMKKEEFATLMRSLL